jgi:hypothetical protein
MKNKMAKLEGPDYWLNGTVITSDNTLIVTIALCYDGKMVDWKIQGESDSNYHCLQEDGFVWGFSGKLSTYAVFGFLIWCTAMFAIWCEANFKSNLNRNGWKRRGIYRSALDLAEAVNVEIGSEICSYTDREIEKALEVNGKGIGYHMTETKEGVAHIGLSSSIDRKVALEYGCIYA